mmetsp:Transcript_43009/g.103681  ORF Transcript_43009/g.103681 Transcript_43009/m.103681 type:complete len:250 (+) Transcript_43009:4595-5344(+)
MHLMGFSRVHHQSHTQPSLLVDQVLVHRTNGQHGRDRYIVLGNVAVGKHHYLCPIVYCCRDLVADALNVSTGGPRTLPLLHAQAHNFHIPIRVPRGVNGLHLVWRQARMLNPQSLAMVCSPIIQQVRFRSHKGGQRHHDRLTNRINRGVGDLRKELVEEIGNLSRLIRQARERGVVAHAAECLLSSRTHINQDHLKLFLSVTKRTKQRKASRLAEVRVPLTLEFPVSGQGQHVLTVANRRSERRGVGVH